MKKMIVFVLGMFLLVGCDRFWVPFDQMTSEESKIYDSLLNVRSKNFNRAMR